VLAAKTLTEPVALIELYSRANRDSGLNEVSKDKLDNDSNKYPIIHLSYSTSNHSFLKRKILQYTYSTSMLNDLSNKSSILDESPQLLGQRALPAVVFIARGWQNDVDARALACKHFRVQAVLAQVDRGAIDLVQHDSWEGAGDLDREVGTLNHIHGADKRLDQKLRARAVVDADGIGFALHDDGGVLAARDEDALRLTDFDLDRSGGRVEVLDQPLVAVELFLALLLYGCAGCCAVLTHRDWLGLGLGTAAARARDVITAVLRAKRGVLVCHLRFVDLLEALGNILAAVQLGKDSVHVTSGVLHRSGRAARRRRRRWVVVEVGKRRWRRWRCTTARSRCWGCAGCLVVVGIAVSLGCVDTVVVPSETGRVVLLDVTLERLQERVVRLNILDVFLIAVRSVSIGAWNKVLFKLTSPYRPSARGFRTSVHRP
jgi:hypothetical protein